MMKYCFVPGHLCNSLRVDAQIRELDLALVSRLLAGDEGGEKRTGIRVGDLFQAQGLGGNLWIISCLGLWGGVVPGKV